MIERTITSKLEELFAQYPVVTVTGPRRSGKTTLLKNVFPDMGYISLEDPDTRLLMEAEPRSFLENFPEGLIIDEAQNVPDIFSYIQGMVDKTNKPSQYVLSGSQSFTLHSKISQTLAGRTAILKLLPLSYSEIINSGISFQIFEDIVFPGFYPEVIALKRNPVDYYGNYLQTYVERDVRQLKNIGDLSTFIRFLKLCAGRIGQLLDYSSLANDTGIAVNTVKSWISVLEASYVIFLLQPHHKNFNKRLVKSPKIYFLDTGLACSLLNIESQKQLFSHYLRGGLFENFVLLELLKQRYNEGKRSNLFFWRDHRGHEIDFLIENAEGLQPVECKSGKTYNKDFFKEIHYLIKISEDQLINPSVVYGGDEELTIAGCRLLPWKKINKIT